MNAPPDAGPDTAAVLVVDDEPEIRAMLAMVLEAEGFAVKTAADGIAALQVVEKESPAVVVTDLMMPRLDGWALIERIREARVPVRGVIAMSAGHIAAARPPAADHFIAKPIDIGHVVASVFALTSGTPDETEQAAAVDGYERTACLRAATRARRGVAAASQRRSRPMTSPTNATRTSRGIRLNKTSASVASISDTSAVDV
jgi:DNA-binding response OmpR family regulator